MWGISLIGNDEFIVAGSNDSELMVWSILPEEKSKENNDVENKFNVS